LGAVAVDLFILGGLPFSSFFSFDTAPHLFILDPPVCCEGIYLVLRSPPPLKQLVVPNKTFPNQKLRQRPPKKNRGSTFPPKTLRVTSRFEDFKNLLCVFSSLKARMTRLLRLVVPVLGKFP